MSTPKLEDLLERGDRAPNFFLPDQRDIIINLNVKIYIILPPGRN